MGEIKMRTIQTITCALLSLTLLIGACSKTAETPAQAPAASPATPASSTPASGAAPQSAPAAAQPEATAPAAAETGAPAPSPSAAAAATTEQPAAPATPPPPKYKEVTLAEGTMLGLRLDTAVASDTSKVEDPVRAVLRQAVTVDGREVLPAGTELAGTVTHVERSGRVKGLASIAYRFDSLRHGGERYDVRTSPISHEAKPTKKKDATKIGIGAGIGAAVGGILGGGGGAAKGAAIGGAAGTGAVVATRGEEVRMGPGSGVNTKLVAPLTLRVKA
jgi:hypothetical protein